MASASAKVAVSGPRSRVADWSECGWPGVPGLTTVSAGLTFRSGGIRTRAAMPSGVTSAGMGEGWCQGAQPAISSGINAHTPPNSRGPTTVNSEHHARAMCAIGTPPIDRTAPRWNEVPVAAATAAISTT